MPNVVAFSASVWLTLVGHYPLLGFVSLVVAPPKLLAGKMLDISQFHQNTSLAIEDGCVAVISAYRWLDDGVAESGDEVVKVGIGKVIHLPFASTMNAHPDRINAPPPPLPQWDHDSFPILLHNELEVGEKGGCVIVDGADVEDAAPSIRHDLDTMNSLGLLAKPFSHLMLVDAPLRWDSTLSREVEGKVSAQHDEGQRKLLIEEASRSGFV